MLTKVTITLLNRCSFITLAFHLMKILITPEQMKYNYIQDEHYHLFSSIIAFHKK
jgi:hypothetical protein